MDQRERNRLKARRHYNRHRHEINARRRHETMKAANGPPGRRPTYCVIELVYPESHQYAGLPACVEVVRIGECVDRPGLVRSNKWVVGAALNLRAARRVRRARLAQICRWAGSERLEWLEG